MSKLHELLAVSSNMTLQVSKVLADLTGTFSNKAHLFTKKLVTFQPSTEGATPQIESQSDIQTTVVKEIDWVLGVVSKGIDLGYQIDTANTAAVADVVTEDGETLLKAVPATFLLQLEKRVKAVRDLFEKIPTLDPSKGFSQDPDFGVGVFKAREVNKNRTAKIEDFIVVVPATAEHPAQVAKVNKDVVTGRIQEQEWSSLITPALKSDLLNRADVLLRAIKKALARANETSIDAAGNKIGKNLLAWLVQPLGSAAK